MKIGIFKTETGKKKKKKAAITSAGCDVGDGMEVGVPVRWLFTAASKYAR